MIGYDNIWQRFSCLKIWNLRVQKKLNAEKISFKFVQIKFFEIHIVNQRYVCDIFTVTVTLLNNQMIFWQNNVCMFL